MNLNKAADLVEEQGRFGDTELVHLNPLEVKMLEKMVPGGKLTRNPVTGKREAFVGILSAIVSIVTTGASIAASRKNRKKSEEAAQEAAYVEGAAPVIPNANQLAIETIGDAVSPEMAAPDFREALADTYGGDVYETQDFQSEQIPPELLEALMQQQMSGPEPTNVQFANSGGPVGLPQDVYQFPVEKISQMQMDVDPGVRNVGNAMMAQMEGNPGMGMVSASAADIDQMAAGGPVQPKKYQDGSDGGLRGYLSMDEMPEDATDYDKLMQLQLIASEVQRNAARDPDKFTTSFASEFIEDSETGDLIPVMKGREYYGPMTNTREDKLSPDRIEEILEMVKSQNRHLSDNEIEKLGLPSDIRLAAGGPVQPRMYDDGGVVQEAIVDTVTNQIPGVSQVKILRAIEMTDDPEEKRRLARQLIPGYGLGEMGVQGVKALGSRIRERRANRREEAPALGPQMRSEGGSVRPKKYQDGDQVKGTDQSLSELKQIAKSRGISRIEELLGFRLPEGLGEQDIEDVLLNAGLGELGIPITKRGDNYSYARRLGEDSNINVSVNPDQKAVQLGFEKRFNTGGPVQSRRYQDGSEGGIGELYKKIPTNLRLFGEYLAGVESPITEKDFTTEELDLIRNQIIAQKINNEVLEDEYRKAGDADAVETFETTRGRTSVSPYDIQESGLPRTKTTFGRSYLSGGSGAVDKGWEDALRSLDDPRYTVATSLGKYTAEDVEDGFRIRENYDFNRGASDRPSPIQDVESFDQLKNLLTNMQATPEVVGETLANLIKSDPRAVDIRL